MKVLVTGGTGFLGSHLVEQLLENPANEVIALVRDPSRLRWLEGIDRVRILEGDLLTVPALPTGLSHVFHLAGLTKTLKSKDYYTVNQKGTASLLRALEAQKDLQRFVHVSSVAAGGPSSPAGPVRECDPPRPVSPYGVSKLKAEEEVLKIVDRLPAAILRLSAVYGPRDEDFLEYFRWMRRGVLPLVGRRLKSLSICYVKDAVRAALLAADSGVPSGEIFNIAAAEASSWEEIGRAVARFLECKLVCVHLPLWTAFLASAAAEGIGRLSGSPGPINLGKFKDMKPDGWVVDVRKARDLLGFETAYSLEEGLKETLQWYRGRGWL